jgi:hypothetical protein
LLISLILPFTHNPSGFLRAFQVQALDGSGSVTRFANNYTVWKEGLSISLTNKVIVEKFFLLAVTKFRIINMSR